MLVFIPCIGQPGPGVLAANGRLLVLWWRNSRFTFSPQLLWTNVISECHYSVISW